LLGESRVVSDVVVSGLLLDGLGGMNRTRTAAAVLATLLALTACSSSSSNGAPDAPAAPTPHRLSAIVLRGGDLPNTFHRSAPSRGHAGDAAKDAALVACAGGRNTKKGQLSTAKADFHRGANQVTSSATRYRSQRDVAADTALLRKPRFNTCYRNAGRKELSTGLPAGASLESLSFRFKPGSKSGPRNVAGTGTGKVTLTANGQTIKIYMNVYFITGPRIEVELDFAGFGAPIAHRVQQRAVARVARRAARG
jgi:hypothetical protein